MTKRDPPEYSIAEIGLPPERSPSNLRRLTVTQIPAEDNQQMLVWNTRNDNLNKNNRE